MTWYVWVQDVYFLFYSNPTVKLLSRSDSFHEQTVELLSHRDKVSASMAKDTNSLANGSPACKRSQATPAGLEAYLAVGCHEKLSAESAPRAFSLSLVFCHLCGD